MTNERSKKGNVPENPHIKEATVKIKIHANKNRLRPKKPLSHAVAGNMMALDTR